MSIKNPTHCKIKNYIGLFCIVAMFTLVFFKQDVSAGEVYTAEALGHYSNPISGEVEDSGNNPGIGNGMVSNTVHSIALIEKDDNGKLFATVRYGRRPHIKDVKMWVQANASSGFREVPVEETQTAGDTGDFRFEIPSTDALIKSSFFVNDMGRDVIFFVTLDNLEEGSGDFKTFVSLSSPSSNQEEATSRSQSSSSQERKADEGKNKNKNKSRTSSSSQKAEKSSNKNKEPASKKKEERKSTKQARETGKKLKEPKTTNKVEKSSDEKINQADLGYAHGLLTNSDFDDDSAKKEEGKKALGPLSMGIMIFLIVVAAIIFTVFILGAVFVWLIYEKTKKENLILESRLESKQDN